MSAGVVIAVLVAGGLGALARYGVSLAFAGRSTFPHAVLVVNALGSALAGMLLAVVGYVSNDVFLILITGLCGGLPTFSTWSVETIQLATEGRMRAALLNVGLNLVLGIAVAALCYYAVRLGAVVVFTIGYFDFALTHLPG